MGDCIRSTAGRVSLDGLEIGKINDRQKDDDAGADGYDIADTQYSQGKQYGERRLRPITSGAERIQTKYGNARCGPNLLCPFLRCGQGSSENEVS